MAEHDLSPKRALITGAGKRIGRALAEALGEDGWSVAVHYRSSAQGAEETAREIEAAGGTGISGLEMLLHQAYSQVEQFTGMAAPKEVMRRVVQAP